MSNTVYDKAEYLSDISEDHGSAFDFFVDDHSALFGLATLLRNGDLGWTEDAEYLIDNLWDDLCGAFDLDPSREYLDEEGSPSGDAVQVAFYLG